MTEHTARKARKAIRKKVANSTHELMNLFNLSFKEARRCEIVTFSKLFRKGRLHHNESENNPSNN